jgi:hypothetical protein
MQKQKCVENLVYVKEHNGPNLSNELVSYMN